MRLLPRRRRAEAKAWAYLALFGECRDEDGEDDASDGESGSR